MELEPQIDLENLTESEGQKESQRSEKEQATLLDRAIFITKVLGRRSDLLAVPGGGWAAGLSVEVQKMLDRGVLLDEIDPSLLEPKVLIYPEKDLAERGDNYILGVNRHEIGHFLHSDYRKLLEFQKQAKNEGKNPSDAMTLANAIEDPRVNNLIAGESFRARERLEGIYHEDMPNVLQKFEEMSPPTQFCFLALSSWVKEFSDQEALTKAIGAATSPEAINAFNEALPKIKEAIAEKNSVKAYDIISQEIWPIYKDLVDDFTQNQPENREKLDKEIEQFDEEFGPKSMEQQKDKEGIVHYRPKEISDKEVEVFKGKLDQRNQELIERQAKEREALNKKSEQLRQQMAALSERRTGLSEGELIKYHEFLTEMSPYINQLKNRLKEIFPQREDFIYEKGRRYGSRITPRRLAREAPTGRGMFFEKKEIQEKPQAICSILVDVSGSMHWGGAIELAVKEMIMLTEALNSEEIDFELIAFSDTPEVIKKFNEKVSGATRKQIIGLLESGGGGTALGKSVEFGAGRLEKQMRQERLPGFLVVHTDGQPGDDLKSALEIYQQKMPIIGIGVGQDVNEQSIKEYFGASGRYTANPIDAPREITDVLKQQFSRYQKKY